MPNRLGATIARSNNEKLHEIETKVKTNREPKRAGAQYRQTEEQPQQDDVTDIDGVLVGFREMHGAEEQ
jgi:hypothetical protein